ncbi:MAG: hypothetical protein ACI9QD_000556, partial [Thermoproteota archaeon]
SKNNESILSTVPDSGENVYRSIMVITDPTLDNRKVIEHNPNTGNISAYSSKFNSAVRSMKYDVEVPLEGNPWLGFDTIFYVESKTNFSSKDEEIRMIADFDLGHVLVNGKKIDRLRLSSGDYNLNTINETNPKCDESVILPRRIQFYKNELNEEEKEAFKNLVIACRQPSWIKKWYDLSAYRGQTVEFEIRYTTDSGYTEFGIVIDNIEFPNGEKFDFEDKKNLGQFKPLVKGKEATYFNQYYLMEHRLPSTEFKTDGELASYNMDNNISHGTQTIFNEEGENLAEKFRMVTFSNQPGVLVWYFNSKYPRGPQGNNSIKNQGQGNLLVLNSKVQELILPGVFSNPKYLDESGAYPKVNTNDNIIDNELEVLVKQQKDTFACFGLFDFYTYVKGFAPECNNDFKNYMKSLTFNGLPLIFSGEQTNTLLPKNRYATFSVGTPFRTGSYLRAGLSTFRPKSFKDYSPFRVYKEENGQMVLDQKMTNEASKIAPVSVFYDADNLLSKNPLFQGDSVVVVKKGFKFEVAEPSPQIIGRYLKNLGADDNDSDLRAPKTKIYFSWK